MRELRRWHNNIVTAHHGVCRDMLAPMKRTARKVGLRDGDQSRKMFYAQAGAFRLRELHYLAAAVYNATAGSPAVSPSGQKCPYYQTRPGLRRSGRLLEAKGPAHSARL